MKILLSAYLCSPAQGSGTGIGWNWAVNLAKRGHEVCVLTRQIYQEAIEEKLAGAHSRDGCRRIRFVYHDNHRWWRRLRTGFFRSYLYSYLWQCQAYLLARKIHANENFDLVHHVTPDRIRQPSFMGLLKTRFIFGPVGGGERAPLRLRVGYSRKQWIRDLIRDVSNSLVRIDPLMWLTFSCADWIYVTTPETKYLVPSRFRSKTFIEVAIGLDWIEGTSASRAARRFSGPQEGLRILFAGRFYDLKGMHLALPAIAKLIQEGQKVSLTLVGSGPDESHWRSLVQELGISQSVTWITWVNRDELKALYLAHDVFLFPSLHDSGGNVLLEAMASGLPIVCFDLGGPGVLVNSECGVVIATAGLVRLRAQQRLADALAQLGREPETRFRLGCGGISRVQSFTWSDLVDRVYRRIPEKMDSESPVNRAGLSEARSR